MAKKHLKQCSTSIVNREMQIKTTLIFYLTPVRMAKIKNLGDSRCWRGCGKWGTLLHFWWDCELVQQLWKLAWQLLRNLDIVLPEVPAKPLMGIYPKDSPTYNKNTCSSMFKGSLIYNSKNPDVLQQRNAYRNCGSFTQWSITQLLKAMNSWNS